MRRCDYFRNSSSKCDWHLETCDFLENNTPSFTHNTVIIIRALNAKAASSLSQSEVDEGLAK